jgi:hypothetical protein
MDSNPLGGATPALGESIAPAAVIICDFIKLTLISLEIMLLVLSRHGRSSDRKVTDAKNRCNCRRRELTILSAAGLFSDTVPHR